MVNTAGKLALGAGSLAGADYLTGHVASSNLAAGIANLGQNIAGQTTNILSGAAANTNAAPILGSAAPLASVATGGYALYRGYQKTKEHGIIRGVQEGSLAFGAISGVGAMTGLMATSALTSPLLATGLGIYGARKSWELGKQFMEAPAANTWNGITRPFKWSGKALKSIKNGWGRGTPPTP